MAEPPAKKAKVEEAQDGVAQTGDVEATVKVEPEPSVEHEQDAKADKSARLKGAVEFLTKDTTINVMHGGPNSVLVPLTDGGMQYLLAGARANAGVKSGRYMFEAKIIEIINPADDPAARQRTPMPRNQLRIGFAAAGSSLFLGETEDSICFDNEGFLIHRRSKTSCAQKFAGDVVVSVVLNLDPSSPNANTVSLFRDGVRASQPQPLPESLRGKELYPAVTFKNVTVHYNFGPAPLAQLPFKCRMIQDASAKEAALLPAPQAPKDGRYEVLFPICLPDEGTFDWLDMFLETHPEYTELSDRSILAWAESSGLAKPKGAAPRTSNDKPEMGFGISALDDWSIRRVLQALAPVQSRHFVVMEVKASLVKEERRELLMKWLGCNFKKVGIALMGDPPQALRRRSQELALKAKQEAADAEFKARKEEEAKKRLVERRQRELERERVKALKKQQRAQEELKRKTELEKRKAEAAAIGEDFKEEDEALQPKEEEEEDDEKEEPEEEEKDDKMDEDAPRVELTAEEKKLIFRENPVPDLTSYALSTSFTKFSLPDRDEGFDELRFEWASQQKCKDYLRQWIQDKKTTTRIEDLTPGEWFANKWKEWQKTLQSWHAKQNAYKAAIAKQAQERPSKEARKAAAAAAREARAKAAAEAAAAAAEKAEGEGKPAEETPEQAAGKEEQEPDSDDEKVDFEKLDVFSVEDILNIGGGEPLFSSFGFEDWTMMSLRFEMHLLAHSFKRDVNDMDRMGIHVEHLGFYYNKYFKKALNHKFYGVDTIQELLEMTRDTVAVTRKGKVVEPQLPDDMESLGIFVMLTEEARRDRARRVDMGDETARLKLSQPQVPQAAAVAAAAVRPPMVAVTRPVAVQLPLQAAQVRPQAAAQVVWQQPGFRPPMAAPQVRAFQAAWRPGVQWRG